MGRQELEKFKFERFTIRNGLSSNTIYGVLQDKRGLLWISTTGGLNRYDGYRFQTYHHDYTDPRSLSFSSTGRMVENPDGRIWVGTWGGGLNLFDPVLETFTHFKNDQQDPKTLSENRIQSLYLENGERLWVGTYSQGLNKLNPQTGLVTRYPPDPNDPHAAPGGRIWSIVPGDAGQLWLGTEAGVFLFDAGTGKVLENYRHDPDNPASLSSDHVKVLLRDSGGRLWAGTRSGLNVFLPEARAWRRFLVDETACEDANRCSIRTLFEDRDGRLWIGTIGGGLLCLLDLDEPLLQFTPDPLDPRSLSNGNVERIFLDRGGVMWIATLNGLNKVDLKPRKFKRYRQSATQTNGLSSNEVGALYEDARGRLWVGTFRGGLNLFDLETETVARFDVQMATSAGENVVRAIAAAPDGRLWIGTYSDGLQRLDEQRGEFDAFTHDPDDPDSLSNNRVRALAFDSRGRGWVGTDAGLNLFEPGAGVPRFANPNNDPFLNIRFNGMRIYTLREDRDGRMWVGTNRGLARFDAQEQRVHRFNEVLGDTLSLSSDTVFCVVHRADGKVWVGTESGLNLLEPNSGESRRFYTADGLPSNIIHGLLLDDDGALWIGTNNGLSVYREAGGGFRNYDVFDGLQDNDFNRNAAFKGRGGYLYFGGRNGFNRFLPSEVRDNPYVPPVILTGFRQMEGRPKLPVAIWEADRLELSHDSDMMTLEYAALDYTNPEKNQYAIRLLGFNDEWVNMGTTNHVTYTNLDPGTYTFQVRGSNNDLVWNENGLNVTLEVVPPLWLTWWAYVCYVVLGLSLMTGIPLWRIRALNRRRAVLAKTVATRTAELQQKNQELGEKNSELVTLDLIVHAINREVNEDALLRALLLYGMKLVNEAERGLVLIFDHQAQLFRCADAEGAHNEGLASMLFSREEIHHRYLDHTEELHPGIFMMTTPAVNLPDSPKFYGQPKAKSMLIMTVTSREFIEDLLVFENFERENVFRGSDIAKLARYREHAITAIAKAKLFHEATYSARHLRETQRLLLDAAHHAGMSEIAANVLHNVGNTLNSLNTSTGVLRSKLDSRAFDFLKRMLQLLEQHADNLDDFVRNQPRGAKVAPAFLETGRKIAAVHEGMLAELKLVEEHIARLNGVVRAQQDYVAMEGLSEMVDLHGTLEEVLQLERYIIDSKRVQVVREYGVIPRVKVQKSKLIRVIVNLVNNAVDALETNAHNRLFSLRTGMTEDRAHVFLEIRDNGIGIPEDVIGDVFHQGFTTKEQGSGFGLHYCANVMREMGGTITVVSDGPGEGTVVRLQLQKADPEPDKPLDGSNHHRPEKKQLESIA
nr:sensor histidine kinase [Acanthopleuribacter pedis]